MYPKRVWNGIESAPPDEILQLQEATNLLLELGWKLGPLQSLGFFILETL
jgi:hypothetical protein